MWPFNKLSKKSVGLTDGSLALLIPSHGSINVFKSFLKGGLLRVDHRLAYTLHDKAAPLANATNRIADAIAQLEPFVVDEDGIKVDESAVLDTLNDPGFGQTRTEVVQDFVLAFLLTNNAYWITDRFKKTLRVPKPFNVGLTANVRDSYVDEYCVTSQNGASRATFNRQPDWKFLDRLNNELLHTKTKTRNDGLEGRSPIEPIFTDVGQRISGGAHNLALLTNGLRPTGNLSTDETLSDDQYARLKEQIEKQHAGAENAGSFLITEGGLKYVDMAKTNREMDYVKVIATSSEAIAQAFKVPLPLVATTAQTLDNFSQATLSFYDDAVFPTAEIVFHSIEKILGIEEGFRLTFDKNEVPAIRMRRLQEADTKHKIGAFSDNETRVDLATEPYEGGDAIFKPANLIAVGADDGALDDGEIEGDAKEFIILCMAEGMTRVKAAVLWCQLNE
ncbi:MAG: phage portal protein [Gammaproteobacteria bacterium]